MDLHCKNQLGRYASEINESLNTENIENLFSTIKESYYEIKKILNQNKKNTFIQNCVSQSWFKYGFDKLLISTVGMFTTIDKNSFCAVRRQIYRYALKHFYTVLKIQSSIGAHYNIKEIFNFLFLTILELSSLPQSINQIILTVIFLMSESKEVRHQFLFQNHKFQHQNNQQLLSFQNLVFIMFQNKEKFSNINFSQQEDNRIYREIKMNFIQLFQEYGYELKEMEKYIEKCRKQKLKNQSKGNKNNVSITQFDLTYQQTLKMHGFPPQVKLKHFLKKQSLAIITDIITTMRQFYLDNWTQSGQNQEYLAECIEATRLLVDFTKNDKMIKSLEDQLGDIINLLTINSVNIQVKNQTIFLIDSIIYYDEKNIFTDFMIRNQNLFQKLWSYQEPSYFQVKMNSVSNMILCTSGFHALNKHLSEVVISLYGTEKFLGLALNFINNYFLQTKYDLQPRSRVDLVIDLLYSLPGKFYTKENLELQFYILSHLYDNGFNKVLPQRYQEWLEQINLKKPNWNHQKQNSEFWSILDKIFDIYSHYAKQCNEYIMENE